MTKLAVDIRSALAAPSIQGISENLGLQRFAALVADPEQLEDLLEAVNAEIEVLGKFLGYGTSRRVYMVDGLVCKVPIYKNNAKRAIANCQSNLAEVAAYETGQYAGPVVPCRIAWHESGVPLVVMEAVDVDGADETSLPAWAYDIDSWQVAWSDLLGCLACYDAGYPVYNMLTDAMQEMSNTERLPIWIDLMRERAQAQAA